MYSVKLINNSRHINDVKTWCIFNCEGTIKIGEWNVIWDILRSIDYLKLSIVKNFYSI